MALVYATDQAEDAFRISKSDLSLRPVFHQKTQRVEAHILVCFLSLALWRTLEMWMHGKGLGNCARQLIKEVATVRSLDVVLPVKETESQQTREVRCGWWRGQIGRWPNCWSAWAWTCPAPKIVQNVVEKNGL